MNGFGVIFAASLNGLIFSSILILPSHASFAAMDWPEIHFGQAVAQMLLIPVVTPEVEPVPLEFIHQEITARGATGGILGTE